MAEVINQTPYRTEWYSPGIAHFVIDVKKPLRRGGAEHLAKVLRFLANDVEKIEEAEPFDITKLDCIGVFERITEAASAPEVTKPKKRK